jgi:hypothetical protein
LRNGRAEISFWTVDDMDYEGFFKQRLDVLRSEGRYRSFARDEGEWDDRIPHWD